MKQVSIETTIGFSVIFSILFWAVMGGKLPALILLVPLIAYVLIGLYVQVFIIDKKRITKIETVKFYKGEFLKINSSRQNAIVVDVEKVNETKFVVTLLPIKLSKYKIVNKARALYSKVSYWLNSLKK